VRRHRASALACASAGGALGAIMAFIAFASIFALIAGAAFGAIAGWLFAFAPPLGHLRG
jgi:hypothetical protein